MASVLVVDDDTDVRESLCDFLTDEGFAVRRAADGLEALNGLRNEGPPDVVLLDLQMPVMDGYEFLQQRDADESISKVPVIVVSATIEQPPAQPVAAVFQKPVSPEVLLQALRQELPERPTPNPAVVQGVATTEKAATKRPHG